MLILFLADLTTFKYDSTSGQGGEALERSFNDDKLIRVFRSSNLLNKYAPPPDGKTPMYRYGGLYKVAGIVDDDGFCVDKITCFDLSIPPGKDKSYIFKLTRMDVCCILSTTQLRNCIKDRPNQEHAHPRKLKDKWNNQLKKRRKNEWIPKGQITETYTRLVWTNRKNQELPDHMVPVLSISSLFYQLMLSVSSRVFR